MPKWSLGRATLMSERQLPSQPTTHRMDKDTRAAFRTLVDYVNEFDRQNYASEIALAENWLDATRPKTD